ncbi:MAG TPA: hypothetical protein VFA98_11235 [Thermoanaerobaculia bacterium]|nr:hypothetical protein [Thermoanaerobaculia bacterium]
MIRHETITVSGTVLYCDGCGKRGPESAYDNVSDTMDQAEMMNWTMDDDDHDLCDECSKKKDKKGKKK